jgi:threonine/homoserine/homoserine lactone efflux protein
MAFKVYVEESLLAAVSFSIGVMLVEITYVRISLIGMNWVLRHKKIFRMLEWISVFVFLALAIANFIVAERTLPTAAAKVNDYGLPPFIRGVFFCAVNPVQIPFWFLWSSYLISNKKLQPITLEYNWYCLGIGLGTLAGQSLYMFGGKYIAEKFGAKQKEISYFVAAVFFITALFNLYKLLKNKNKLDNLASPAKKI